MNLRERHTYLRRRCAARFPGVELPVADGSLAGYINTNQALVAMLRGTVPTVVTQGKVVVLPDTPAKPKATDREPRKRYFKR